jgi:hypothetical protein
MNGYLISTDDDFQADSTKLARNFGNMINELQEMMADVGITDRRAEDTARVDHIHRASISEILKACISVDKPGHVARRFYFPPNETSTPCIWPKGPSSNFFQRERGIPP